MSNERMVRVLDAAYACFTRHGVRRTTMEDIAAAAGMSRPALYQHVRNKDDAFRRLADALFERALDQARAAAAHRDPLDKLLHRVLATKLDLTLTLFRDSPHAPELLSESARLTGDLAQAYTRGLTDLVTDLLRERAGQTAAAVAEIAIALTRGLEADLSDPDLPRQRLREGIALIVAGLPRHPGGSA